MVGKDQLSSTLRRGQAGMKKLGKATRDTARQSERFSKFRGQLNVMSQGWTKLASQVYVAQAAFQTLKAVYTEVLDFIQEGEHARNVGIAFAGMATDAKVALGDLKQASKGTFEATDLQEMAVRVRFLGGTFENATDLIRTSFRASQAGIGEFKGTFDRLLAGIVGGRATTLQLAGVFIDLKKAVADAAEASGSRVEEMSQEEVISARMTAVTTALEQKYRKLDIRFSKMTSGAKTFRAEMGDLKSDLQVAAVGGDAYVKGQEKQNTTQLRSVHVQNILQRSWRRARVALAEATKEIDEHNEAWSATETNHKKIIKWRRRNEELRQKYKNAGREEAKNLKNNLEMMGLSWEHYKFLVQDFADTAPEDMKRGIRSLKEDAALLDRETGQYVDAHLQRFRSMVWGWNEILRRVGAKGRNHFYGSWRSMALTLKRDLSGLSDSIGDAFRSLGRELMSPEMKKRGEEHQKRLKGKGASERKARHRKELDLIAKHNQALASLEGDREGELHRHAAKMVKIGSARYRLDEAREAALGLEKIKHNETMRGVADKEQKALEDAADRKFEWEQEKEKDRADAAKRGVDARKKIADAEHEANRLRMEEERELREEGLQLQITMGMQLQNISKQNGMVAVGVFGTLSAAAAQTRKDFDQLKKGSPAAIGALASVASGAIKSEKARAVVSAAVAQGTALLELSRGNLAGYIAGQASAIAFLAVAGKGGGAAAKAPKATGLGTGGGQTTGALGGAGGNVTVNVQGFVGSTVDLGVGVHKGLSVMGEADFAHGATI